MTVTNHKYTNGDIFILWQPEICIHSGICARGLHPVFDPARKPWVDMSKAATDIIIQQVKKCSGEALTILEGNKIQDGC
ncbi:MAG: (4Fe-4S)-binding protein [Chitinophagaceae bacterium]|nr:(4Fe-4S)-binding protein [Chitinophagaceae bacterium]